MIVTRQKHRLSSLQLNLTLEKTNIEQVHEHRVLGVTIDAEMKWQSHLSNVCQTVSKTNKQTKTTKKTVHTLPTQVLCK